MTSALPPGDGRRPLPAFGPPADPEPPQDGPPGRGSSSMRTAAIALAAALIGGAVAATAVRLSSGSGGTTTVVQTVATQTTAVPVTSGNDLSTSSTRTVGQIYREAAPGVVTVLANSTVTTQSFFGTPQQQTQWSQGSGFVIDTNGDIITNDHVIAGAKTVRVSFADRDNVPAKIVGADPSTDIAVLRVSLPQSALHPLPLGRSARVQVGDPVVAIGNPFGLDRTVTAGIVSAVQREITSPNRYRIENAIQTDAAINHGNSGGPLINAVGAVIGINSQLPSASNVDGNVGVGFAIPIDLAKVIVHELITSGVARHPWLGIQGQTIDTTLAQNARITTTSGVLVATVTHNSPAARAGLKGGASPAVFNGQTYCLGGDAITAIDGRHVSTFEELKGVLDEKKPGAVVRLAVVHSDGSHANLSIPLGTRPANLGQTAGPACG